MELKLKQLFNPVLLATMTLISVACSEEIANKAVENEEIAEIIGASLSEDSKGLSSQMVASAELSLMANTGGDSSAGRILSVCGQEFSEEFSEMSNESLVVYYDYSFGYSYAFTCNQLMVPNLMNFVLTQSGDVDAPRYSSNNESNGSWSISGLELSTTAYSFDGEFSRVGDHNSKTRNQNSFDFNLSIVFEDVKMNKGNYVISQGTGAINISGEDNNGNDFSAVGTVEFLGGQQILLTINEESYIIDIGSGEVTLA